jgi:hypothetical protein
VTWRRGLPILSVLGLLFVFVPAWTVVGGIQRADAAWLQGSGAIVAFTAQILLLWHTIDVAAQERRANEEQDQRSQAERVAVWVEVVDDVPQIFGNNSSGMPVYSLTFTFRGRYFDENPDVVEISSLAVLPPTNGAVILERPTQDLRAAFLGSMSRLTQSEITARTRSSPENVQDLRARYAIQRGFARELQATNMVPRAAGPRGLQWERQSGVLVMFTDIKARSWERDTYGRLHRYLDHNEFDPPTEDDYHRLNPRGIS